MIGGPARNTLHIWPPCNLRVWAEGSPCTGFTLSWCSSSRKRPLGACRAEDGGPRPTAPITRWAGTVGVVCKPWVKRQVSEKPSNYFTNYNLCRNKFAALFSTFIVQDFKLKKKIRTIKLIKMKPAQVKFFTTHYLRCLHLCMKRFRGRRGSGTICWA